MKVLQNMKVKDIGLSNCIEKVGSNFIRIDFGGFEQFLDEFSLYKIVPIKKRFCRWSYLTGGDVYQDMS